MNMCTCTCTWNILALVPPQFQQMFIFGQPQDGTRGWLLRLNLLFDSGPPSSPLRTGEGTQPYILGCLTLVQRLTLLAEQKTQMPLAHCPICTQTRTPPEKGTSHVCTYVAFAPHVELGLGRGQKPNRSGSRALGEPPAVLHDEVSEALRYPLQHPLRHLRHLANAKRNDKKNGSTDVGSSQDFVGSPHLNMQPDHL